MSDKDKDPSKDHENQKKKVSVKVDNKNREVLPGSYTVSDFKAEVKVDAEKVLEELIDGVFKPLEDNGTIVVKEGDVFVSHVRRGGSSWPSK